MNNEKFCFSHIGNRNKQEDNFLFQEKYLSKDLQIRMKNKHLVYLKSKEKFNIEIFAIADGLGGHKNGEKASYICITELNKVSSKIKNVKSEDELITVVQDSIIKINKKILNFSKKNKEFIGMGTTLILLVKFYKTYYFFNIGDSRAYYFNKNIIVQLTRDHTEGQRLLDSKIISKNDLGNFKNRFTLNRFLGINKEGLKIEAEQFKYKFKNDGFILLCSDGLTDSVSNKHIQETLVSSSNILKNGKLLIKNALNNSNVDNLTFIIIPIEF